MEEISRYLCVVYACFPFEIRMLFLYTDGIKRHLGLSHFNRE